GQRRSVPMIRVDRAEAPGPVWVKVELGLARADQLGQGAADPAGASETVQRQPGRKKEAAHARYRSDQWVGVGRHGIGVADELHNPGLTRKRKASRSAGQERLEPRLVGRERRPAVLP